MNLLRCSGLLIVVLLGACDSRETPVPKPKTESSVEAPASAPAAPAVRSTADTPSESVVSPDPVKDKAAASHDMLPNVPVVPVVAGKGAVSQEQATRSSKTQAATSADAKAGQTRASGKRDSVAENRKKKAAKDTPAKDVRLTPPKLDLSLPPELVKELEPPAKVIPARRKPILPPMFDNGTPSDGGPFELNGRLLSNEMQLQMRNDNRRDVEGAALDFKFKQ